VAIDMWIPDERRHYIMECGSSGLNFVLFLAFNLLLILKYSRYRALSVAVQTLLSLAKFVWYTARRGIKVILR
jgi:hypothetical protein